MEKLDSSRRYPGWRWRYSGGLLWSCQAPFDQGTAIAGGKSAHRITLGVRLSLRLSVNYSDYHWHLRRGAVDYSGTLAAHRAVSTCRFWKQIRTRFRYLSIFRKCFEWLVTIFVASRKWLQ